MTPFGRYYLLNVNSKQAYPVCYGFKKAIYFDTKMMAEKFLCALRDRENYLIEELA